MMEGSGSRSGFVHVNNVSGCESRRPKTSGSGSTTLPLNKWKTILPTLGSRNGADYLNRSRPQHIRCLQSKIHQGTGQRMFNYRVPYLRVKHQEDQEWQSRPCFLWYLWFPFLFTIPRRRAQHMATAESIEWFIDGQAFSPSYDLAPLLNPSPLPSENLTSDTQEDWERETTCRRERGWVGKA